MQPKNCIRQDIQDSKKGSSKQGNNTETSRNLYSSRLEVLTKEDDHKDGDKNMKSSKSYNTTSKEFLINDLV